MSTKLSLIIIFLMIAFLGAISLRRFERFEETITEKGVPKIEIPEINLPEFDLDKLDLKEFGLEDFATPPTLEQIKENYKTFVSPDKTLKIKYPANWQAIDKAFLEQIGREMKEYKLAKSELLFLAYQMRLVEHPPLLIIQSMPLEKGLEEVIEEMERIAKGKQAELIIIKTETKNEMGYFEAKYKKENYVFYLKGGVAPAKEKNYLITILVLDQFQEEIAPQIDFIFGSIQIVQ